MQPLFNWLRLHSASCTSLVHATQQLADALALSATKPASDACHVPRLPIALCLPACRFFQTEDWNGIPGQWWFGGGTDITPIYVVPEDLKHFHGVYKAVCDRHDPEYFPKFKKWCDEYFTITHRKETRGLGGIFFDDLNDR